MEIDATRNICDCVLMVQAETIVADPMRAAVAASIACISRTLMYTPNPTVPSHVPCQMFCTSDLKFGRYSGLPQMLGLEAALPSPLLTG